MDLPSSVVRSTMEVPTNQTRGRSMSEIIRIGVDLSKSVFTLHGIDREEHCQLRKSLQWPEFLSFFTNFPATRVGMEAGSGAHHWAPAIRKLDHDACIMDPKLVARYRHHGRSGKNDANDAEAICEAMSRSSMRYVPIKASEQQVALVIHRA
jgi:transposase